MIARITRRLLTASAFAALAVSGAQGETIEERKAKLLAREKNRSKEALDRKKRGAADQFAERAQKLFATRAAD